MSTYREAGVDLDGADRHIASIAPLVTATWGPDVVGGFGGFAAGIELPAGMRRPVLMLSTDGVGTKLEVARRLERWEGVGFDLVAMCVDDLTATGARAIGFVDYLAVGALDAQRDTAIVGSIARACSAVGCALVGGETAEHPGVMDHGAVDLAGAALGVVERGEEITGAAIASGDRIVGLRSPNLRSNGFSLVRRVIGDGWDEPFEESTIGETALEQSVLYAPAVLEATAAGLVKGAAHITGGGLPGNLGRPLPEGLGAVIDTSAWEPPAIYRLLASRGGIAPEAMFEAFNMGVGFCLIVEEADVDEVMGTVEMHMPTVIGHVEPASLPVRLLGL